MYYVTPHSPNPDCPSGEPCLTINEYAQGNHFAGDDNITLLFQNGEHNLSTHNLEIAHRDKLEMMPLKYNFQHEISAIQLLNMTSIKIENISSVTITKLNFFSNYHSRDCLSTSDISKLSVDNVFLETCQLSVQGEVSATINSLYDTKGTFLVNLKGRNTTIFIKNSSFKFVQLVIWGSTSSAAFIGDLSLTIENSMLNVSNIIFEPTGLRLPYKISLSILDTLILGTVIGSIAIDLRKGETNNQLEMFMLVQGCSNIENSIGITVSSNFKTAEIVVDQSYVANNGNYGIYISSVSDFSITVVATITSTVLSGNVAGQIVVYKPVNLTMYNCTLRGRGYASRYGFGISFYTNGVSDTCMNNLTQTMHVNESIVSIENCLFENTQTSIEASIGLNTITTRSKNIENVML